MTPIDGIDHLQGWYLAYTKPRQEEVARINLEQQKFHVYLPLFKNSVATNRELLRFMSRCFRATFFDPPMLSKASRRFVRPGE